MEFKDYYQILGVSRDADQDELRKAYRQLARKYHPDVYKGEDASDRFKSINEAYEVLSDPDKRARYDRFGKDWEHYQAAPDAGDADFRDWFTQRASPGGGQHVEYEFFTSDAGGQGGFSDFFDLLFGGGRGRQDIRDSGLGGATFGRTARPSPERGRDREHPVSLTLAEAYSGTTRTFELQTPTNGAGSPSSSSKIEVTIPPGVREGSRVRVAGKGEPGRHGGSAGDIYLRVKIKPDPVFRLDGTKLHANVKVPLYTAMLGGEVTLNLPSGRRIAVSIPPETPNGKVIRLRAQGWPKRVRAEEYDDLLVHIQVELPTELSDEERRLFEQLKALREKEPAGVH